MNLQREGAQSAGKVTLAATVMYFGAGKAAATKTEQLVQPDRDGAVTLTVGFSPNGEVNEGGRSPAVRSPFMTVS
jgi:hypothetical protein